MFSHFFYDFCPCIQFIKTGGNHWNKGKNSLNVWYENTNWHKNNKKESHNILKWWGEICGKKKPRKIQEKQREGETECFL